MTKKYRIYRYTDVKIRGACDTEAQKYADKNGIKFVSVYSLVNYSTISTRNLTLGQSLIITGKGSEGAPPYTYAYYYKKSDSTKWTVTGPEFGKLTTMSFKPAAEGSYDIKVIVKDADGKTAEKLFKVTVAEGLTNTSWLNAEKVQIGDDIRVTGAAEGGAGGYKYAFYFKRSANSKWNKLSYGSAAGTYAKFTPTSAASYDIKVVAIDSAGTKASKEMTITAS